MKLVAMRLNNKLFTLLIATMVIGLFATCAKETRSDVVVYENDFESGSLTDITDGKIDTYNGTKVLGRYNDGGFTLNLTSLPVHTLVEISFDLYIHDTWDGNKIGNPASPNGPDIWNMKVEGNDYIYTTFSNGDCGNGQCLPQSYPYAYLNSNNNPSTGAVRKDLKGYCAWNWLVGGTSLYRITKRIAHDQSTLTLQCLDKLIEPGVSDPLCDESWSVDNITVRAINL